MSPVHDRICDLENDTLRSGTVTQESATPATDAWLDSLWRLLAQLVCCNQADLHSALGLCAQLSEDNRGLHDWMTAAAEVLYCIATDVPALALLNLQFRTG